TLVALLRHGARSGSLSQGRMDVVDHDVDIMVGVRSEQAWAAQRMQIEAGLRARGWSHCIVRSSVDALEGTEAYYLGRTDLLLCFRQDPPLVMDITSYVASDAFGGIAYVQRFCPAGPGSASCYVPADVGAWKATAGRLRQADIYPLGRCKAGARLSVPCPRRPLRTLQAFWNDMNGTSIAVPDLEKRRIRTGVLSDLRETWQSEALSAEDVQILRQRSAQLDAAGFMSMTPYF
ncbi:unnamed protein product, partial [Polarella glacialis]